MAHEDKQHPQAALPYAGLPLKHPASTPMPVELRRRGESVQAPQRAQSGERRVKRSQLGYVAKSFVRLGGEARVQASLLVLARALALIREHGRCHGAEMKATGPYTLTAAIAASALGKTGLSSVGIEAEYAREVLRDVLWTNDLGGWNDSPIRRRADVVTALRRAIARAGRHLRRGGWLVSEVRR